MNNNYTICTLLLLFSFLLQGCLNSSESDFERQVREADEIIQAYLANNDIEAVRQSSGVYIEVLEENENGKQVVKDHVAGILYSITHLEGEYEIESHSDSLNPLRFSNSYTQQTVSIHPAGLNFEIEKMRLGETFRFFIPSYLAFGAISHEDLFDSHSHLIVDVNLIELKTEEEIYAEELAKIQSYIDENQIEPESYPNGLYHMMLEEGNGAKPNSNSQVTIHFTRKYLNGDIIEIRNEENPLKVNMNTGNLVRGFEDGVLLMSEGEKAKLIMPSKIAFGKSVQVIPQKLREEWVKDEDFEFNPLTKPYSPVIYEVELVEIH